MCSVATAFKNAKQYKKHYSKEEIREMTEAFRKRVVIIEEKKRKQELDSKIAKKQKESIRTENVEISKMTIFLMKILDFESSRRSKISKFRVENWFEGKKNCGWRKKVVEKTLRKPLWTEKWGRVLLNMLPARYFEAVWPSHLLAKREVQRTNFEERSAKS